MASFNLVREPWIPVERRDGTLAELSLADVFAEAHHLVGVKDENPLTVATLHRLILAVIHRALNGPESPAAWSVLWASESFAETPIPDYLARWEHRFDLFSDSAPFMQTAGFRTEGESPVTKLALERAAKSNKTLFDHTVDSAVEPFSASLAARALVTTQGSALGGGKCPGSEQFGDHPNYSNAPLASGAVVLLLGANLKETLCLNTLIYTDALPFPRMGEDRPAWEDERVRKPGDRLPDGYVDYLTWTSRHIRLLPETANGGTGVRWTCLSQGQRVEPEQIEDPMFAYRVREVDGKHLSIRIDRERAAWRDAASFFAFDGKSDLRPHAMRQAGYLACRGIIPGDRALRCCVLGLANDQANPLMWRGEQLPVTAAILGDAEMAAFVRRAIQDSESARQVLRAAGEILATSVLPANPQRESVKVALRSLRVLESYWAALEIPFRRFLSDLPGGPDPALESWQGVVCRSALQALANASDNCAGRSPRELEARIRAEERLLMGLGRLRKEESN